MEAIGATLEQKFPCREAAITTLGELIGDAKEAYPSAIYLFGHSGTGKTALTRALLKECGRRQGVRTAQLNAIECYTTKIMLENVLDSLTPPQQGGGLTKADNMVEFVEQLRRVEAPGFLIAVDNAERLRDMDANVLPVLLRLQQLTSLNLCVILLSQLPFEKFYNKTGLSEVISLHLPQYNKAETQRILGSDFVQVRGDLLEQFAKDKRRLEICEAAMTEDFYNNYLNLFLSVFYKACRDLPELQLTARKCFAVYLEPVLDGTVEASDISRLWRHIAGPLRAALTQIYMRIDIPLEECTEGSAPIEDQSVRKLAQSLELPYYAKFLLIAAFLASHNAANQDKRLFVKHHGKQRKRMQTVNARAKTTEKMSTSLGPKSFSIDRLLAIFYAILEEKVGLTCNLLSQISTLVHLKLLGFVSGEQNIMDGSARLQCTVGLEFVLQIGKVVGFNVRQYLCDFM